MKNSEKKISWQGKLAVVTGASSGIGAATARLLAKTGLKVLLVARRQDKLEKISAQIREAGGECDTVSADLTVEADRQRVYEQTLASYPPVSVLVNNAGIGWYGYGAEMTWKTAQEMLQTNVVSAVHLSLLYLQQMKQHGGGHIINIGSISGSLPSQGVALYGATKSFLDAFTTALFRELHGTGIHLSVVRAGPVRTEFCEKARERPGGLRLPTERIGVTAERIASGVLSLLKRPRRVMYIPRVLSLTPVVEAYFGWLIDRLGPLLLRKETRAEH
jgi:short-subunit dehydrogenase